LPQGARRNPLSAARFANGHAAHRYFGLANVQFSPLTAAAPEYVPIGVFAGIAVFTSGNWSMVRPMRQRRAVHWPHVHINGDEFLRRLPSRTTSVASSVKLSKIFGMRAVPSRSFYFCLTGGKGQQRIVGGSIAVDRDAVKLLSVPRLTAAAKHRRATPHREHERQKCRHVGRDHAGVCKTR